MFAAVRIVSVKKPAGSSENFFDRILTVAVEAFFRRILTEALKNFFSPHSDGSAENLFSSLGSSS